MSDSNRPRPSRPEGPSRRELNAAALVGLGVWALPQERRPLRHDPIHGLCFSPFVDGQDPNQGAVASAQQVAQRLQLIAGDSEWIRTFGVAGGLATAGAEIHRLGSKAAIGAWISGDVSADAIEVQTLIARAHAGEVDVAIVGSEVLLRDVELKCQLVARIREVRQAIPPWIPVATADVYGIFLQHPDLLDEVDLVLANLYGYWEGVAVEDALDHLSCRLDALELMAGPKPVWISEVGWPSAGSPMGAAVPSAKNAALHFARFVSWAEKRGVPYFYFTGLSEDWKLAYEGSVGPHWGIRDKHGVLKPGMQAAFQGLRFTERIRPCPVLGGGGAGSPDISYVSVPVKGSTAPLIGSVNHVNPLHVTVATLIRVQGNYWLKPTFKQRLVLPDATGTWRADITTGEGDENADRIVSFLLPIGYFPPPVGPAPSIPTALVQASLASVQVDR